MLQQKFKRKKKFEETFLFHVVIIPNRSYCDTDTYTKYIQSRIERIEKKNENSSK